MLIGLKISQSKRIFFGYGLATISLVLYPFDSDKKIEIIMIGIASGMIQGTLYGMAGPFPPQYMGAVMLGNGIG